MGRVASPAERCAPRGDLQQRVLWDAHGGSEAETGRRVQAVRQVHGEQVLYANAEPAQPAVHRPRRRPGPPDRAVPRPAVHGLCLGHGRPRGPGPGPSPAVGGGAEARGSAGRTRAASRLCRVLRLRAANVRTRRVRRLQHDGDSEVGAVRGAGLRGAVRAREAPGRRGAVDGRHVQDQRRRRLLRAHHGLRHHHLVNDHAPDHHPRPRASVHGR
mmetsp:Transcript_22285/g.45540  ORF Transcript_22285/g.45540 Transcript_22285/m.45540 type:complete len:215 (-) Transcript_22285:1029-1673(-)